MNEATRITVQLTANAVKQLNAHILAGKKELREYDERNLATCLAACKAQGLNIEIIRDIDSTVAVSFKKLEF